MRLEFSLKASHIHHIHKAIIQNIMVFYETGVVGKRLSTFPTLGIPVVWLLLCLMSLEFLAKDFPHSLHSCSFDPGEFSDVDG